MNNIDNKEYELPCPKCGNKIKETLGRLKQDADLTCSQCGAAIKVDAQKFREGMESLEKSISDIRSNFKNLFK